MPPQNNSTPARRPLTLDVEKYQRMLDAPELSDKQRREFVEALWSLVVSFVDLGFEVGPAKTACGQDAQCSTLPRTELSDVLELNLDLPKHFAQSSAASAARQEGVCND